MLLAVRNQLSRLVLKAELALRAVVISFETARQDRLYGALLRQTAPTPRGVQQQSERLFAIVRYHCDAGTRIVDAQATAAVNLDAAEYALSSLLDELRGVMKSAPASLTSERSGGTRSRTHLDVRAAAEAA